MENLVGDTAISQLGSVTGPPERRTVRRGVGSGRRRVRVSFLP